MSETTAAPISDLRYEDLQFILTLYETQSLTQSALIHELSMGAASRRLSHAREVFGDELFVRSGMQMLPTARMRELALPVRELMKQTRRLFDKDEFDLRTSTRSVRIISVDNGISTLLNHAVGRFFKLAPNASCSVVPLDTRVFERLRQGEADMAFYPIAEVPADFHELVLYRSRFGILVREGHPLIAEYEKKGEMTTEMLAPWRAVANAWGMNVDETERTRWQQQVGFGMPYFLVAPYIVSQTDFTFAAPAMTLLRFAQDKQFKLRILPAPKESALFCPRLIWHHSTHRDPFLQWVRGLIVDSCREEARKFGVIDTEDAEGR